MYNKVSTQREELHSEIDHLKADKDMLQSALDAKQIEVNGWVALWEKELVLRQKKDNQVISMGIVAVFLFIVSIISLFI